jgi:hypothetical protein
MQYFSTNSTATTGHLQKINLDTGLTLITKIISKWITELNVKHTKNLLEKKFSIKPRRPWE